MALVGKPTMTEKKIAANQENGSLSHGPRTAEGKERSRAAHLRYGLYAQAREIVLPALGEDPAFFQELLAGLWEEFHPVGRLQEELVFRLARALWLMDRADRAQEGDALLRARSAEGGRENRLHARMMRLKMTAESLRSLARSVAERHYVTAQEDLEVMKKLHQEGVASEMGEIALALFYQLQAPGTDEDGVDPEEKRRRVVNSIRSIFGLKAIKEPVQMLTPAGKTLVVKPEGWVDPDEPADEEGEDSEKDDRYPDISEEDWVARERARKLLKNILSRQAEVCESQRKMLLRESLAGPSIYERAAGFALANAEALLARRAQESYLREVRRLTNLLLKIQRTEGRSKAWEVRETPVGTHDFTENKDS